jgi:hypothetical protein
MMKEYKKDKRVLIPRDEFEEEAGEGLGGLSRDEAEADLLELKARMARRVAGRRAIWLPAAAAVVILLVASALLVTMLRDKPEPSADLALSEAVVTDTAYIAMAEPLEKKGVDAPAPLTAGSAAMQTKEARYSPLAQVIENEIAGVVMADEIIVAEDLMAEEETDYVVYAVVQEELDEVVVVQAVPQVQVTGMASRTKAADRVAVPVAENRRDKAAVAETAKKDVAAVADSGSKKANAVEAPTVAAAVPGVAVPDSPAAPAGGWDKYREWVTQNIRYPEGIKPVERQEVMVSFIVRSDSTLADLKAVRSPGEPFTREVFRLLREGPRWVPSRAGGAAAATEVYVMFVFR